MTDHFEYDLPALEAARDIMRIVCANDVRLQAKVQVRIIEALESALATTKAEAEKMREANRKLHRRTQVAEKFIQSSADILKMWENVFKQSPCDRTIEMLVMPELMKARDKAIAAIEASTPDAAAIRALKEVKP